MWCPLDLKGYGIRDCEKWGFLQIHDQCNWQIGLEKLVSILNPSKMHQFYENTKFEKHTNLINLSCILLCMWNSWQNFPFPLPTNKKIAFTSPVMSFTGLVIVVKRIMTSEIMHYPKSSCINTKKKNKITQKQSSLCLAVCLILIIFNKKNHIWGYKISRQTKLVLTWWSV